MNERDQQFGWTKLHGKIADGATGEVASLLEQGADPCVLALHTGKSPLHIAAEAGSFLAVRILLGMPRALGVLNQRDSAGQTALHLAALGHPNLLRSLDTLRALLKRPEIAVNAQDAKGMTPLALAAFDTDPEPLQILVDEPGVDVNLPDLAGNTPLMHAIREGNLATASVLLRARNIDVNAENHEGSTALHLAIQTDQLSLVEQLLEHPEIECNAPDGSGQAPLFCALTGNRTDIALRLIASPAVDCRRLDKAGNTPLHQAAILGNSKAVTSLLTRPDSDPGAVNDSQQTAADCAEASGHQAIALAIREALRQSDGEALQLEAGQEGPKQLTKLDLTVCRTQSEWRKEVKRLLGEGVSVEQLTQLRDAHAQQKEAGMSNGLEVHQQGFQALIHGNTSANQRNAIFFWSAIDEVLKEVAIRTDAS